MSQHNKLGSLQFLLNQVRERERVRERMQENEKQKEREREREKESERETVGVREVYFCYW